MPSEITSETGMGDWITQWSLGIHRIDSLHGSIEANHEEIQVESYTHTIRYSNLFIKLTPLEYASI